MQCPSCLKTFATELSVCPRCGAMPSQHVQAESSLRWAFTENSGSVNKFHSAEENPTVVETGAKPESAAEVHLPHAAKREFTSTLIEFPKRSKNPEWRDEIRERVRAVQERRQQPDQPAEQKEKPVEKAKTVEPTPEPAMVIDLMPNLEQRPTNRLIARALERVERSRQNHNSSVAVAAAPAPVFTQEEETPAKANSEKVSAPENRENVAKPLTLLPQAPSATTPAAAPAQQKILVPAFDEWEAAELKSEAELKPEAESNPAAWLTSPEKAAELLAQAESAARPQPRKLSTVACEADADNYIDIQNRVSAAPGNRSRTPRNVTVTEQEVMPRASADNAAKDLTEDYAPLGLRFAAGVLDVLLCAGITAGLFALFAPTGFFESLTLTNVFTFVGVLAIIKFVYLTVALVLTETTISAGFFSLRTVHAEDGSAPTIVEAAINNAVYICSLAIGGLGLLPILFNSEKRAVHDILSGTIVIREN